MKIYHTNPNQKKAGVTILILNLVDCVKRKTIGDRKALHNDKGIKFPKKIQQSLMCMHLTTVHEIHKEKLIEQWRVFLERQGVHKAPTVLPQLNGNCIGRSVCRNGFGTLSSTESLKLPGEGLDDKLQLISVNFISQHNSSYPSPPSSPLAGSRVCCTCSRSSLHTACGSQSGWKKSFRLRDLCFCYLSHKVIMVSHCFCLSSIVIIPFFSG